MNIFYSANGIVNKFNIIENFESPNEGVSIISHLIDSEKQKNKINELENEISNLKNLISESENLAIKKINELKNHLPYDNNTFNKITSKKDLNWFYENDIFFILVEFDKVYNSIPKVFTEIISTKNYILKIDKMISDLNKKSFRLNLKLIDFNLEDYNIKNNTNHSSELDMIRSDLSLNYTVIG